MTVSGIHDSDRLQSGFPIRIDSGMTICESVNNEDRQGIDWMTKGISAHDRKSGGSHYAYGGKGEFSSKGWLSRKYRQRTWLLNVLEAIVQPENGSLTQSRKEREGKSWTCQMRPFTWPVIPACSPSIWISLRLCVFAWSNAVSR